MRYYIDTEFIDHKDWVDLISIGIVAEDGREFYEVSSEFCEAWANGWVKEHVLPKLPTRALWRSREDILRRLRSFIGDDTPEFWGYFADYDWVVLCKLFGAMTALPAGWPMFCLDLRQSMHERGIAREQLPPDPPDEHDALVDARWLRDAHAVVYGQEAAAP